MKFRNRSSDVVFSIVRIERLLVEMGAVNIFKGYDEGVCGCITFELFDEQLLKKVPFHFRVNIERYYEALISSGKKWRSEEIAKDKAVDIAWLFMADWVEFQCSSILLQGVKPLQVFLPYAYDKKAGETLFDKVANNKVKLFLDL